MKRFGFLFLPFVWILFALSFVSNYFRYKFLTHGTDIDNFKLVFSGFWYATEFLAILYFLTLFAWLIFYINGRFGVAQKIVIVVIGFLSVVTLFVSNSLINLELNNYGNYLYSVYGVTKHSMELIFNTSLATVIFFVFFVLNERKPLKVVKLKLIGKDLIAIPFLGILLWYSFQSIGSFRDYLNYSKYSYDNEFKNYQSIVILKRFTPLDAKIIVPSQNSEWNDIGNTAISRYFLFPRNVVSSSYVTDQKTAESLRVAHFIGLKNEMNKEWPILDLNNKTVSFDGMFNAKYYEIDEIDQLKDVVVYKITFRQ